MNSDKSRRRNSSVDSNESARSIGSDKDISRSELPKSINPHAASLPFWKNSYNAIASESLTGDRLRLPPSAIKELLGLTSELPHPLTFEISFPLTKAKLYGSVREFTSEEGNIEFSNALANSLGVPTTSSSTATDELEDPDSPITSQTVVEVKLVSLPKCTFCKFSPLDADYLEIPDHRASFESYIRQNYATIVEGELLQLPYINAQRIEKRIPFLIAELKPEKACLVIDTDMEIDIIPLSDELAKEAVSRKMLGKMSNTDAEMFDLVLTQKSNPEELEAAVTGVVEFEKYRYYR
ncbi:hypothetical protein HK096_009544, partial [Nowakowskiella sp. JEL0078]